MKKIIMTVELEYDDIIFHEKDERSFIEFIDTTLNESRGELLLHSNKWGATIGSIKVEEILKTEGE